MVELVDVVVACSHRKRLEPVAARRLRAHRQPDGRPSLDSWLGALHTKGDDTVPAARLYAGEHWQAVLNLAKGRPWVRTWICSAGYGLVPLDSSLCSYGATFGSNHLDSVSRSDDASSSTREWWNLLAEWPGPTPGAPRRLVTLAKRSTGAVVVALSPTYLGAARNDITAAVAELGDRIVIISTGARNGAFNLPLATVDGRMRNVVGGSMQSLNVRVADLLLARIEKGTLSRQTAETFFETITAAISPLPRYERSRMTDEELTDYITQALRATPDVSCTALHRQLRDSGSACEQKRFRHMFRELSCHDG